jgi:hypothetical protein
MKSLNMKLALSALAIAMLATPALAKTHHQARDSQDYVGSAAVQPAPEHYPDGGAGRTGTAESFQSGAEFNLGS